MTLGNIKDRTSNGSLITHCPCCQKITALKIFIHAHDSFTTSIDSPMDCLNIDFIGPFPDKGYILVVDCTFTAEIRSDRKHHFIAEVIKQFLTHVDVEHELTLAYSKEENAIVERFNKEINRHLRALPFEHSLLFV